MRRIASLMLLLAPVAVSASAGSSLARLFGADLAVPRDWLRALDHAEHSNTNTHRETAATPPAAPAAAATAEEAAPRTIDLSFDWSGLHDHPKPTLPPLPSLPPPLDGSGLPSIPPLPSLPPPLDGSGLPPLPAIPSIPAIPALPEIPSFDPALPSPPPPPAQRRHLMWAAEDGEAEAPVDIPLHHKDHPHPAAAAPAAPAASSQKRDWWGGDEDFNPAIGVPRKNKNAAASSSLPSSPSERAFLGSFDWDLPTLPPLPPLPTLPPSLDGLLPPSLPDAVWQIRLILLGGPSLLEENKVEVAARFKALLDQLILSSSSSLPSSSSSSSSSYLGAVQVEFSSLASALGVGGNLRGSVDPLWKEAAAAPLPPSCAEAAAAAALPTFMVVEGDGVVDENILKAALMSETFPSIFDVPSDYCGVKVSEIVMA